MLSPSHRHSMVRSSSTYNSHTDLQSSGSSPSFLCTICWQDQPEHHKPKLLGTSARIVCQPCWRAVLDLSICWVCGECIVRGDEVVSLGWCFWHRSCFGCLVCGTKMNVENKATWDGKGLGVELEEVPLCVVCDIDMTGEKREIVIEKGLATVSRFDGGLSRDRLSRFEKTSIVARKLVRRRRHGRTRSSEDRWVAEKRASKSRSSSGSSKRSRGAIRSSEDRWDSTKDIYAAYLSDSGNLDDMYSLLEHAADMGISEDGTTELVESPDEFETPSFRVAQPEDERREIYVSVFDPFGQPAFKPSKTKPLPKWMQLLPNNVHRERDCRAQLGSAKVSQHSAQAEILGARLGSQLSVALDEGHSKQQNTGSDDVDPSNEARPDNSTTPPMDIPIKPQAAITFDSTIPSLTSGQAGHQQSQRGKSIYVTPPEYPSISPAPRRQKTPFPGAPRPPFPRSMPAKGNDGQKLPSDSCCQFTGEIESSPMFHSSPQQHDFVVGDFVSPVLTGISPLTSSSSEYLERYRPQQVESRSPSYIAKDPEPILAKIKRQRVGKQNLEQIAGETKKQRDMGGKKVETLGDEEFGLDPRREDLQKELRNLFYEE